METLLMIAGGIAFAAFFLWIGWRGADRNLPPDLREFAELDREYERLHRQDPAAAEQLMRSYEARQTRAREELKTRAENDPGAAAEFYRQTQDEINDFEEMVRDLRRAATKKPTAGLALANAEDHLVQLRKELDWSRKYLPRSGAGAA